MQIVAGLVTGAAGAYAGLFALLSITGLDQPDWAPVAMLVGAGLVGTAVVMLIGKASPATLAVFTMTAALVGGITGLLVRQLGDSYEWTILTGVVIIGVAVAVSRLPEPAAD